jgi:hypothetical protein
MHSIRHVFAGITFLTKCDAALIDLENDWIQKNSTAEAGFDVFHQLCRVEEEELNLPSLSPESRELILRCSIQTKLGPGSFILPPFIHNKDEHVSEEPQLIQNPLDVPLLRSQLVRERLETCMDHPEQVRLTPHLFSVAIYDYRLHRIDVFYRSPLQWVVDHYPLENGLRRMFTTFLPSFSCVMLHSSGIIRNGRAGMFFAPDAGGKSTVLKNNDGGVVLSDDQNIVRRDGESFQVHSTPWGHLHSGPQNAPLGGLFLIEKAPDFELLSITPREMFQFLWNEHMHVWNLLPGSLRRESFEMLVDICCHTPCHRMRFPKDHVDWNAIDDAMAG